MKWTTSNGIDFSVERALLKDHKDTGAGIYFGENPHRRREMVEGIPGKLGDYEVLWYSMERNTYTFARECWVKPRPEGYTILHVWVYSNSEEGLQSVTKEVSRLRLFSKAVHGVQN